MPAAGPPREVSSTCVVSFPMRSPSPVHTQNVLDVADKVYTLSGATQAPEGRVVHLPSPHPQPRPMTRRPHSAPTPARAAKSAAPRGANAGAGLTSGSRTRSHGNRRTPADARHQAGEQRIADVFKVSRTLVASTHAAQPDKLITLEPPVVRGWPSPAWPRRASVRCAQDAGACADQARRGRVHAGAIAQLRAHLDAQTDAVQRTDVTQRTRLLADFHVLIAQMLATTSGRHAQRSGVALLADRLDVPIRALREHSRDEHVAIVDAWSAGTRAPPRG